MPRSFAEFMDHELGGRRDVIRYQSEAFTIIVDPIHEARAVAAIQERRLQEEAEGRLRGWIRLRNVMQFA